MTSSMVLARFFRMLGILITVSAGYFIYMERTLIPASGTIVNYDSTEAYAHPFIRFNAQSPNTSLSARAIDTLNQTEHPVGSTVTFRYPEDNPSALQFDSFWNIWGFYIVITVGLIAFFYGVYLTKKARKVKKTP